MRKFKLHALCGYLFTLIPFAANAQNIKYQSLPSAVKEELSSFLSCSREKEIFGDDDIGLTWCEVKIYWPKEQESLLKKCLRSARLDMIDKEPSLWGGGDSYFISYQCSSGLWASIEVDFFNSRARILKIGEMME